MPDAPQGHSDGHECTIGNAKPGPFGKYNTIKTKLQFYSLLITLPTSLLELCVEVDLASSFRLKHVTVSKEICLTRWTKR